MNLLKSILHNIGVVAVGFLFALTELEQIDSWVLPVFPLYLPLFLVRRYSRPAFLCEYGRRITFTAAR